MLDVLDGFIDELRMAGLPISLREATDAASAVMAVDLADRVTVRSALGATLVKTFEHRELFLSSFDTYFALQRVGLVSFDERQGDERDAKAMSSQHEAVTSRSGRGEQIDAEGLRKLVLDALVSGEQQKLDNAAVAAVAIHGGVDASRPVGASYYVHRTLRGLELDAILARLLQGSRETMAGEPALSRRLVEDEYSARAAQLRERIEEEIRRLLVAHRGAAAVAKSQRRSLAEDIDFMHASGEELVAMRRAVYPLARVLAARLARRRRHRRAGHLDFRATMRRSLSTGGVPIEPRFRSPHPARPEIFLLADVSGSVAAFARFTVHLVYAISVQFSKVRAVVFIDGIDEVTEVFKRSANIAEAVRRMVTDADVVHGDGHSDYGNAFELFNERYARSINKRTNLIVLGDARNNYHAVRPAYLKDLQTRARRVYWLNPEPKSYWGSGDSVIEQDARFCDAVFECRNLRQLKAFVEALA